MPSRRRAANRRRRRASRFRCRRKPGAGVRLNARRTPARRLRRPPSVLGVHQGVDERRDWARTRDRPERRLAFERQTHRGGGKNAPALWRRRKRILRLSESRLETLRSRRRRRGGRDRRNCDAPADARGVRCASASPAAMSSSARSTRSRWSSTRSATPSCIASSASACVRVGSGSALAAAAPGRRGARAPARAGRAARRRSVNSPKLAQ